jgi:hypothetical protein
VHRAWELHFLPGELNEAPSYRAKGCRSLFFNLVSFLGMENGLMRSPCCLYVLSVCCLLQRLNYLIDFQVNFYELVAIETHANVVLFNFTWSVIISWPTCEVAVFDSWNPGMADSSSTQNQRFILALIFIALFSVSRVLSFVYGVLPDVPRINHFRINSAVEQVRRQMVIFQLYHLFISFIKVITTHEDFRGKHWRRKYINTEDVTRHGHGQRRE